MKCILATGISGCGEKKFLNRWVEYSEKHGKRVKIFPVGSMMIEHARQTGLKWKKENILNADTTTLQQTRSAVFMQIASEMRGAYTDYDAVVISMHAFLRKRRFYRAYDRFRQKFSPDMYITFIDDFRKISRRLQENDEWRDEHISYSQILDWQNIEAEVVSGWADDVDKPFFAVATEQSVSMFYKLVFHPEIETAYIQMPISHFRKPEERVVVDRIIKRLNPYFTLFNPLSVEIIGALRVDNLTDEELTIAYHTVHRDIHWFERGTDISIVLWPGPVPSPGVDHESHDAFCHTKDVWVVYLGQELSPFIPCFATKLFRGEDEFFAFLDAKYPERKNFNWD